MPWVVLCFWAAILNCPAGHIQLCHCNTGARRLNVLLQTKRWNRKMNVGALASHISFESPEKNPKIGLILNLTSWTPDLWNRWCERAVRIPQVSHLDTPCYLQIFIQLDGHPEPQFFERKGQCWFSGGWTLREPRQVQGPTGTLMDEISPTFNSWRPNGSGMARMTQPSLRKKKDNKGIVFHGRYKGRHTYLLIQNTPNGDRSPTAVIEIAFMHRYYTHYRCIGRNWTKHYMPRE